MANYGLPYMGSKSKIMPDIARFLPNADHFYDLFGGGFSVTHWMAEHRRKSFREFHFNEIRPGICELVQDSVAGKYNYDVFKPEWISRERFLKEKDSNAYIKLVWSFGNNGKQYMFNPEIEKQKKSLHQAVIFDEFDDYAKKITGLDKWPNGITTIKSKRLLLRKFVENLSLQQLEQLERLERLEQLERLQQLSSNIKFTNLSYEQVSIKPNSVIYCDIPYRGTAKYDNEFDYQKFYDWVDTQNNPVFISEYTLPDERLPLIYTIPHRSAFSSTSNTEVKERIYGNKIAFNIIQKARGKK